MSKFKSGDRVKYKKGEREYIVNWVTTDGSVHLTLVREASDQRSLCHYWADAERLEHYIPEPDVEEVQPRTWYCIVRVSHSSRLTDRIAESVCSGVQLQKGKLYGSRAKAERAIENLTLGARHEAFLIMETDQMYQAPSVTSIKRPIVRER